MANPIRRVVESPKVMGEDESISFIFKWGDIGTPGAPACAVKGWVNNAWVDYSSTCLSGSASVVGTTVVTPLVTGLTAGVQYRLECKATISGNIFERYLEINAEE